MQPDTQATTDKKPLKETPIKNPKKQKKLLFIIGGAVLLLILLGIVLYFLLFANRLPRGPQLFVGNSPYVYSCKAFDAELVAKQLGLNEDKNKQEVETTYAYAPANQQDKEIDLAKLTNNGRFPDNCEMQFDITSKTEGDKVILNSKSVSTEVAHYKDNNAAKEAFDRQKQSASKKQAKALSSFKDDGFYSQDKSKVGLQDKESDVVRATVYHKNLTLSLTAPIGENGSAEDLASKIDTLMQEVIKRIDSGTANQPADFTNRISYGGKQFVDACYGLNYVKVAAAIGDVEFQPDDVSASQKLAPTLSTEETKEKMPASVRSTCTINFRTAEDKEASKDLKVGGTETEQEEGEDDTKTIRFADKFPHSMRLAVGIFETAEAAKQYVQKNSDKTKSQKNDKKFLEEQAISEDAIKIEDLSLGDLAVKVNIKLEPTEEQKAEIEEFKALIEAYEKGPVEGNAGPPNPAVLEKAKAQLAEMEEQLITVDSSNYYIANGQYVYTVSVNFARRPKPFKTSDQQFSDDHLRKLFDTIRQ